MPPEKVTGIILVTGIMPQEEVTPPADVGIVPPKEVTGIMQPKEVTGIIQSEET